MEIGGWGCERDVDFYAWNRCLGVCGVRSWGLAAKATHGPAARGARIGGPTYIYTLKPKKKDRAITPNGHRQCNKLKEKFNIAKSYNCFQQRSLTSTRRIMQQKKEHLIMPRHLTLHINNMACLPKSTLKAL